MDPYTCILFTKKDRDRIRTIRDDLRKCEYEFDPYLYVAFRQFTDGVVYYEKDQIVGFILLETHIDEPSKSVEKEYEPNKMNILVMHYKSNHVFDLLIHFVNSVLDKNNYYCIEYTPENYSDYILFRKIGFFIYNHSFIDDNTEIIEMHKYIDQERNNYYMNKQKIINFDIYPENSIYRQIVENETE